LVLFGVLVIAYFAGGMLFKKSAPATRPEIARVRVTADRMEAEEVYSSVLVFGSTAAIQSTELRTRVAGIVGRIVNTKGSQVSSGAPILVIKVEDRAARLESAMSAKGKADVEWGNARQLFSAGLISRVEYMTYEANAKLAAAQFDQAVLDSENTTIRAPFGGVVGSLSIEEGQYVQAGETLGAFLDLSSLKVKAELPERFISRVKTGSVARVAFPGGATADAKLTFVSSIANQATRTFPIEFTIRDKRLKEGMTAEIRLPLDRVVATHLTVSSCLTFGDDGRIGVKVVNADNRVEFYPVELVREDEGGLWVSGLPKVADVIIAGQEFVRVGETVIVSSKGGE